MGLFGGSSSSGGEMSGYNKAQVEALRDVINKAAQDSASGIVEELTNGVVTPMSTCWYAEEAQQFFQTFANDGVAKCGEAIKAIFDEFRANVEKTGAAWAEATGAADAGTPHLAPLDDVNLVLNVDAIEAVDGSGNRYLNEGEVEKVVGSLETVEANIKTRLSGIANNLDATTAFLGHGQGEAVRSCFDKVSGVVHTIFQRLLVGEDALSGALSKFKEKYAQSAENVATSFNNAEIVQKEE